MTTVPHPTDRPGPESPAPPQSPTEMPVAPSPERAADLLLLRAERIDRTTRLFCAVASRRAARRWAEEHQKTKKAR